MSDVRSCATIVLSTSILALVGSPVARAQDIAELGWGLTPGLGVQFAVRGEASLCQLMLMESEVRCWSKEVPTVSHLPLAGVGADFRPTRITSDPAGHVYLLDTESGRIGGVLANSISTISVQGLEMIQNTSDFKSRRAGAGTEFVIAGARRDGSPGALHIVTAGSPARLEPRALAALSEARVPKARTLFGSGLLDVEASGRITFVRQQPYEVQRLSAAGGPGRNVKGESGAIVGPDASFRMNDEKGELEFLPRSQFGRLLGLVRVQGGVVVARSDSAGAVFDYFADDGSKVRNAGSMSSKRIGRGAWASDSPGGRFVLPGNCAGGVQCYMSVSFPDLLSTRR